MCDSTLAIDCLIDDFLQASSYREDCRVTVADAEVIINAVTASLTPTFEASISEIIGEEQCVKAL